MKQQTNKSQKYLLILFLSFLIIGILYYHKNNNNENSFIPPSSSSLTSPSSSTSSSPSSSSLTSSSSTSSSSLTIKEDKIQVNNNNNLKKDSKIFSKFPLHINSNVTASVRGNLGEPNVVIGNSNSDWLKDRWQAAVGMSGDPIPGVHWLRLTLSEPAMNVTDFTIDFETAYSDHFKVGVFCSNKGSWTILHQQHQQQNQQQQNQQQQIQQQQHSKKLIEISSQQQQLQQQQQQIKEEEESESEEDGEEIKSRTYSAKASNPNNNRIKYRGRTPRQQQPRRRLSQFHNHGNNNKITIERSDKHVIYKGTINLISINPCLSGDDANNDALVYQKYITDIKVIFQQPATRWGISVWKLYVWGYK